MLSGAGRDFSSKSEGGNEAIAASAPLDTYRDRLSRANEELRALNARARTLSRLRLITFLLFAVALGYSLYGRGGVAIGVAAALLLATFIILVRVHGSSLERARFAAAAVRLHELRIAAAGRDWDRLPGAVTGHATLPQWASELDVVGDASLLRLLGGHLTVLGQTKLESWLYNPAQPPEIRERQDAVKELSERLDDLDVLQTLAMLSPHWPERALIPFLEWAEGDDWSSRHKPLVVLARAITGALLTLTVLYAAGLAPLAVLVMTLVISAVGAAVIGPKARRAINEGEGRVEPIESFSAMLRAVEVARFESPKLMSLQRMLHEHHTRASTALRSLRRLIALAEIRYSPMMHTLLQVLFLWDVHLVGRFDVWRRAHGAHARKWLDVLGEFEALGSLAALSHGNPDWSFPVVVSPAGSSTFVAKALGHPLIEDGVRVANDVTVGPIGTFLLVTGSNMSGKSTLLRSIGLNAVLAQAGGPVCARSLEMPSVILAASVQVQDSLAQGVSRFMAELLRLRDVVRLVRAPFGEMDPLPLYLLDEILQGTNTAERQTGARRVILQLLRSRCIGVVTTHDLALADTPELSEHAVKVHFTEGVEELDGRVILSFEYRLLPGVATSVNALKLMRAVGLEDE